MDIQSKRGTIIRQGQLIIEIIKEIGQVCQERQMEKEAFHIFNKATRLKEEIGKLWDALEKGDQELEFSKYTRALDEERLLQIKDDMNRQKEEIEEMRAQLQCERNETEQMKTEIQIERIKLEQDRQFAKAEADELNCLGESMKRQKEELEEKLCQIKRQIREMEVMSAETELKKKDVVKVMRMNRRKEEELNRMREDTQRAALKTEEHFSQAQVKWIHFQIQKQRRQLDQRLERTMRERDELDVMKIKLQRQSEQLRQRMEDTLRKMLTVAQMKGNMETTVAELNSTWGEMCEAQRKARQNKDQVKHYVVSKAYTTI